MNKNKTTIFIAKASWGHAVKDQLVKDAMAVTLADINRSCKNPNFDTPKSAFLYNFSDHKVQNGTVIDVPPAALNRLFTNKSRCTTIKQDGNEEGYGLSLNSIGEATELASRTALAYRKTKQVEEQNQKKAEYIQGMKLSNITTAQRMKKVYFYFKQDYDYRGLDETFKGFVYLTDIVQYEQAQLLNDHLDSETIIEQRLTKQLKVGKYFQYSWSEAFIENRKLTETLLKKHKVITIGEVGYAAFSFKSIAECRSLVEKAFIKHEMDE